MESKPETEKKTLPEAYQELKGKYAQLYELYLRERAARIKYQEENIRLREQNDQLVTGIQGLLRGKSDLSSVVAMKVMEIAEAQLGILNAYKAMKRISVPWNKIIPIIAILGIVTLLIVRPEYATGFGMWISELNNQIFLGIIISILAVAGYYIYARKGAK